MDLSEFDIDFLSQKLSDNPQSPLFARLADLYLSKNQPAEALKLCEAGVQTYPSYSTGYVILGKCYTALNENSKARLAFAQALHFAPFNQLARKLLDETPFSAEEPVPVQETPLAEPEPVAVEPAIQEEPSPVIEEPPASMSPEPLSLPAEEPVQEFAQQPEPEIPPPPAAEPGELPGVDDYIQQQSAQTGNEKAVTLDEYLAGQAEPPAPETAELDSLATKLENAGRIVPEQPEPEPEPAPEESAPMDSVVITPTLAEIYVSQGEYGAAIQAYEILIYSKPNERERFEKRISELQAKMNEGL